MDLDVGYEREERAAPVRAAPGRRVIEPFILRSRKSFRKPFDQIFPHCFRGELTDRDKTRIREVNVRRLKREINAATKPPRFVKKGECGRGPLGVVFRGEDSGDGRSVALRVLPAELLQNSGLSSALVGDLKAAAALSHPNLVKVLGLVDLGGERAVVTEFVQGRHFGEALANGHKMSFQQVHGIARVLAGQGAKLAFDVACEVQDL
jgi:hypothetical protein